MSYRSLAATLQLMVMDVQQHNTIQKKLVVSPLEGVPHSFEIKITEQDHSVTFAITKYDDNGYVAKTGLYQINRTQHDSYLDLFQNLHSHMGVRLPQNRKPYVKPAFKINYDELLLKNLDERMYYGYGDPAIIRVLEQGTHWYYVVSTSNDAPNSFPIVKSKDLTDWEFAGYVFPEGSKPNWAADGELTSDYWAPEIHQVGKEFRVYFVARNKHTLELCIGLAKSSSPTGPFMPEAEPIIKGNVIDPHLFTQDENTTYLFWKEDNNDVWPGALINLLAQDPALLSSLFMDEEDRSTASFIVTLNPWLQTLQPMERFLFTQVFIEAVTAKFTAVYDTLNNLATKAPEKAEHIRLVTNYMKTPMYARRLTPDGRTFIDDKIKVLENDLDWEAHLVEGMWVTKHLNKYYLFYAGNDFSTDQYGIGVAISDAPLGPYKKLKTPILTSTERWLAPGHPSVTVAPTAKSIMILHAYFPGKAGYKQFRALLAIPLTFENNSVYIETPS
jgi:arabinan endo-1,5-alpha-L-arabinosidase